MTQQKTLKKRVRQRMAETGERYSEARMAIVGTAPSPGESRVAEAIVLKLNKASSRVRLKDGSEVTFRSSDVWRLVPGHVADLTIKKQWTYRGSEYASGTVSAARIDVGALGVAPLPLEQLGMMDLAAVHEPFEDPDPYAPMWRELSATPRPAVEFHDIAWQGRTASDSGDPDDCPVSDAAEMHKMGDAEGARELLMEILYEDIRCIDAHAHLGNFEFAGNANAALTHYEMGIRIGALSLPEDEPNLLLPWAAIYNRPYLRCMVGYGLCLWRLEKFAEAEAVFERVLTLNPADNQGVRDCLFDVREGHPWQDPDERDESTVEWRRWSDGAAME